MVSKISDLVSKSPNRKGNTLYTLLCITLLLTGSLHAKATNTLEASVDRNKLYLNESFNLKLTGNAEIDFSFGGLMSFGRNQIEAPVIEGIEENFEILDRQQNYSMRSINGSTTTEVTWNYTLSPKRSGELTIPSASFQDAKSSALTVSVLEGKAPINADNPPSAFIEVEVDKNDVYVQEQVLYTVRLFSLGRLSSGNLSEPLSSDAIVEQFGEETKYYRMAYNQRYEVIERNYLLFPQKSGALEIPSITFNGTLIDSYKRRRLRISEISDAVSLNVSPPRHEFSSNHWLPAKSVHVSEKWQNQDKEYKVGDALTREITISALGLLGSAIPPIPETSNKNVKSYPDKAQVESNFHEAGAQSFRKQATTYIAVKEGVITLPEVKIPWWDTVNDIERIASLPERTIKITASGATPTITEPPANIDLPTNQNNELVNSSNFSQSNTPVASESNHALLSLIVLLVIGWSLTAWYLLQKLRLNKRDLDKLLKHQNVPLNHSSHNLNEVVNAIKQNSPDTPRLVISWIGTQYENSGSMPFTVDQLSKVDKELASQLSAFEEHLYSKGKSGNYDSELLIKRLKQFQKQKTTEVSSRSTVLKPFYPQ